MKANRFHQTHFFGALTDYFGCPFMLIDSVRLAFLLSFSYLKAFSHLLRARIPNY